MNRNEFHITMVGYVGPIPSLLLLNIFRLQAYFYEGLNRKLCPQRSEKIEKEHKWLLAADLTEQL